MNKVPSHPWWSSMGMHKPAPATDDDYADMGTAFGLDASLAPPAEADSPGIESQRFDFEGPLPATDRLNRRSVI